jgi:hypothetical protein
MANPVPWLLVVSITFSRVTLEYTHQVICHIAHLQTCEYMEQLIGGACPLNGPHHLISPINNAITDPLACLFGNRPANRIFFA